MIHSKLLEEADHIINGDREKTYGSPDKNLKLIAHYWSGHLSIVLKSNVALTIDDVCVMMVLLKQARLANTPNHHDSIVDTAGYMALMDKCQEFSGKVETPQSFKIPGTAILTSEGYVPCTINDYHLWEELKRGDKLTLMNGIVVVKE